MSQATLSMLSSSLIATSGVCLLAGWYFIRVRRSMTWHRNAMLMATGLAAAFLVAYVSRWHLYGSKPFEGTDAWRTFYLANLIPHIVLAIAVGPLALRLIDLALRQKRWDAHRRLGRITVPIWLYVAASGWLIYALLYKL